MLYFRLNQLRCLDRRAAEDGQTGSGCQMDTILGAYLLCPHSVPHLLPRPIITLRAKWGGPFLLMFEYWSRCLYRGRSKHTHTYTHTVAEQLYSYHGHMSIIWTSLEDVAVAVCADVWKTDQPVLWSTKQTHRCFITHLKYMKLCWVEPVLLFHVKDNSK